MQTINNGKCNGCGKIVVPFAIHGVAYCASCIRSWSSAEVKATKRMGNQLVQGVTPAEFLQQEQKNLDGAYRSLATIFETADELEEKRQIKTKRRELLATLLHANVPDDFPEINISLSQNEIYGTLLNYYVPKLTVITNKRGMFSLNPADKWSVSLILLKFKTDVRNNILNIMKDNSSNFTTVSDILPYLIRVVADAFAEGCLIGGDAVGVVDYKKINELRRISNVDESDL